MSYPATRQIVDQRPIITAHHLTKTFRVSRHRAGVYGALRSLFDPSGHLVEAVADISFTIQSGEIVAYVGPNGAGKSTTIKMLTGILVPSSGLAEVAGFVPWQQRKTLARQIGVVFGQRTQLWWDLPLIESLGLLRHVYRVPPDRFADNLRRFRDLLDLDEFLDTPVRQLSLGQRMRGDLAAALLHDPTILYLDEPTIGLDIVAKTRIREFLLQINRERAVTIMLTTHDLRDVEFLCQRMIIIDHGRLIYDGSPSHIRNRFGNQRTIVVDFESEKTPFDEIGLDDHSTLPEAVTIVKSDGPRYWFRFDRHRMSTADVITALTTRYRVRDISIEEPDLEYIVRGIYQHDLAFSDTDASEERSSAPPFVQTPKKQRSEIKTR